MHKNSPKDLSLRQSIFQETPKRQRALQDPNHQLSLSDLSSPNHSLICSSFSPDFSSTHHQKMSVLQCPDTINVSDLQIWNNAAFDKGDADESASIKASCFPLQSTISANGSETCQLDSSKENQSPVLCKSPVCAKSPMLNKPLHPNGATGNSQGKPLKLLFKQGLLLPSTMYSASGNEAVPNDKKIDTEIEEIEMEISRLSSKLESLRLEKAEQNPKQVEIPRKVVKVEFMEQKQNLKNLATPKKIEGNPAVSSINKFRQRGVSMGPSEIALDAISQRRGRPEMTPITAKRRQSVAGTPSVSTSTRRGVSLGPSEIIAGVRSLQTRKPEVTPVTAKGHQSRAGAPAISTGLRRGISLGPSEIIEGVRSQQRGKPEITPIHSIQNRRKSCLWKIQEIDEGKVTKQRGGGRSMSLSPKSRSSVSKIKASKQGLTTIGSKKSVRKDDTIMSSMQPKKLFKEEEKSVATKRPTGRVVASRYNQILLPSSRNLAQTDRPKRSLPENDKDERCEMKRASLGKSHLFLPESGLSREIPGETMVHKGLVDSSSVSKIADLLPKIRTIRCTNESPRDSGQAKKVAELVGRKSYFGAEESNAETSVCQALSFDDEEE